MWKKIGLGAAAFIVVIIIIAAIAGGGDDEPETTTPQTPEETIEAMIRDELGTSNRDGVRKVSSIDIVDAGYGYTIDIHFAIDDNLSENFIITGARMDAFAVMEALYTSQYDIQWVDMYGTFSMIDPYGNTDEMEVFRVRLGRDTADKINWDNMTYDRLYAIYDFTDVHPAFQ